ncbi:hypothetical protein GALL_133590 [mine drainage metagenome]|uniref:Uncharacterized protein n=1 Tax=mine drainage metagenome TaxID=410659 RepID=A0A1J5SS23_9ZZZZ
MKHTKYTFVIALSALLFGTLTTNVIAAEGKWAKHHPLRDQVNDRLENQNKRINHEVKEGDLTKEQAGNLRKQDHQIRQEERDMASQNDGHITKQEQKTLNQQENSVSKEIGK